MDARCFKLCYGYVYDQFMINLVLLERGWVYDGINATFTRTGGGVEEEAWFHSNVNCIKYPRIVN